MDDTDTNQAASTLSSPEDILRQFDYLSDVSPAFFPGLRVRRTPPVSPEEEEETKRESPRSETKTPIRQLRFATPIQEDPPSPLPPFEEPEPPIMSGPPTVESLAAELAALPTRDEYEDMVKEIKLLKDALVKAVAMSTSTSTTPAYRPSSAVITSPNDFQRSPYAQPAPFNLTSKSGLLLYTDAQEALKVPFNGKAANVQPFLNSLALEVKKFSLESAVTVRNAAGPVNLLTDHGRFSNADAEAFFDAARKVRWSFINAAILH